MPELPTWEGIEFIAKWRVAAKLGGCSAPVAAFFFLPPNGRNACFVLHFRTMDFLMQNT